MDTRIALGTTLALAGALMSAGAASAQGAAGVPHPAHVHEGVCPAPRGFVAGLSDVSFAMIVDGTATAGSPAVGLASAIPVQVSSTTVDLAMKDTIGSPHSIVVHKSADDMGTYIACGDIGGITMAKTDLPIGLGELNGSGASGVARLRDNGDETTTVEVFLIEPAPAPAVAIANFAFDPQALSVPVGTTLTWTNQDGAPHTATAEDGSFNSKTLNSGGAFSFTFEQAGSFPYFCGIHPQMKGTITVE